MTDGRRATDQEFERVWRAIEKQGEQVSHAVTAIDTHAAVCTKAEEARSSDRAQMKDDIAATKTAVEGLVAAADRRAYAIRVARYVWGIVVALAALVAWSWDHVAPLLRGLGKGAVVLVILLASTAVAHEDDPFLRDLQTPTGGSCCSKRDCSLTDDWDLHAGAYRVRIEGAWREVPAEIVIRDKPSHPSGRAVLCALPAGPWICFLPGSQGV